MKKVIGLIGILFMFCSSLQAQHDMNNMVDVSDHSQDGYKTVQSGNWSNPFTWENQKIPGINDAVIVSTGNTLTLDVNASIAGVIINSEAALSFAGNSTETLTSSKNIVIYGRLIMKPLSPLVNHMILMDSVNEKIFVGAGHEVIDTDKGIWVRGNGTLELNGSAKTAWLNIASGVKKGVKSITLNKAPAGWNVGDEISIAPTAPVSVDKNYYLGFDTVKIKSISGSTVTFTTALTFDHLAVKNAWKDSSYTAEVMNLTRNVRIEGKPNGRSHINIAMTSGKFNISYVQLRYMGARNDSGSIVGRYPLHFHHCTTATMGSLIEGMVIRDSWNRAYVPHASYGITFRNCIAYNIMESPYWWDTPPNDGVDPINNANDILFDSCVSAIVRVGNSPYRLANFQLGSGLRNEIRNCVGIGNQGLVGSAPFNWPESANYTDNLWIFTSNIAHNNRMDGIFGWQNDPHSHTINGFVAYNNGGNGIELGAYTNAYKFNDCDLIGNGTGVMLHANPRPKGNVDEYGYIMAWKRIRSTDPLFINVHTLAGNGAGALFKDCKFPSVIISELPKRVPSACPGRYDFINCNLSFDSFDVRGMEPGSWIRVQNQNGSTYQINDNGQSTTLPAKFFNK